MSIGFLSVFLNHGRDLLGYVGNKRLDAEDTRIIGSHERLNEILLSLRFSAILQVAISISLVRQRWKSREDAVLEYVTGAARMRLRCGCHIQGINTACHRNTNHIIRTLYHFTGKTVSFGAHHNRQPRLCRQIRIIQGYRFVCQSHGGCAKTELMQTVDRCIQPRP